MDTIRPRKFNPLINPVNARPVIVENEASSTNHIFLARPLLGPLLFENTASDARDHCANERTFLSWIRLAIYLAIVSSAILISFHFSSQPTHIERVIALPMGIVFWCMSLACLASGFSLYVITVTKYSRRAALVQSGWKTQAVITLMATVIVGCCILFLVTQSSKV
ncbi:hypothetical protein TSTA_020250 [Talaromyces stipitatus ATCC 10500]|uniref:DUF202 domain-containing protein n=1 Tax=Talaromyces stipitatus (strain ATCC 10500 / CBS 375.48 / QM 6759 / NRRL 1006) TaxID=441959 RepID=B8MET4_TALSN|nr:uncharacterized protein TSTA_020250 [Talaromyces stipitatus ATCC 10500]EED16967.1 hypothetical protein TSTA_020250 [Talaromyces stipitatus ATCC 10500]